MVKCQTAWIKQKKSPGEFTHSIILVPSLGVVWFLFLWSLLILFTYMSDAGDTGDVGSTPGSGRSPGGGHGNPLQYSSLENPTDRGTWWVTVHTVAKSQTHTHRLQLNVESVTLFTSFRKGRTGSIRKEVFGSNI